MSGPKYSRVLLKLGGESLADPEIGYGFDQEAIDVIASEILEAKNLGVEIGIVIGGGNIVRGAMATQLGIDRVTGDYMGMLATVLNALALQSALEKKGQPTRAKTRAIHRQAR